MVFLKTSTLLPTWLAAKLADQEFLQVAVSKGGDSEITIKTPIASNIRE
jgi:hypothetical protein